jgi:hypothetical protein
VCLTAKKEQSRGTASSVALNKLQAICSNWFDVTAGTSAQTEGHISFESNTVQLTNAQV